jgi:hypothetical protein
VALSGSAAKIGTTSRCRSITTTLATSTRTRPSARSGRAPRCQGGDRATRPTPQAKTATRHASPRPPARRTGSRRGPEGERDDPDHPGNGGPGIVTRRGGRSRWSSGARGCLAGAYSAARSRTPARPPGGTDPAGLHQGPRTIRHDLSVRPQGWCQPARRAVPGWAHPA